MGRVHLESLMQPPCSARSAYSARILCLVARSGFPPTRRKIAQNRTPVNGNALDTGIGWESKSWHQPGSIQLILWLGIIP
jgi:hypothetical protein